VQNCQQLGKALAEMHLAVADFTLSRANDLSLEGWMKLATDCEARADECQLGLSDIIHTEMDHLKQNWPTSLPQGIIHADLFPDNVFFLNNQLSGLIDYYFACNDMLVYDVAVCINSWCFEKGQSFDRGKASAIINGYNKVRQLSEAELAALPLLCRGASIRFLLTRLYDWLNRVEAAQVKIKDPLEYLKMLKFHQNINCVSDYGVERKP